MNESELNDYDTVWVGFLNEDNYYTPLCHPYCKVYRGNDALPIFLTKEECQFWCDTQPQELNYNEDYKLVDKLLSLLNSRGGFDGWWDSIDYDTQQEIKNKLATVIREDEG